METEFKGSGVLLKSTTSSQCKALPEAPHDAMGCKEANVACTSYVDQCIFSCVLQRDIGGTFAGHRYGVKMNQAACRMLIKWLKHSSKPANDS